MEGVPQAEKSCGTKKNWKMLDYCTEKARAISDIRGFYKYILWCCLDGFGIKDRIVTIEYVKH